LRSIREDLQQGEERSILAGKRRQLAIAAEALLPDYMTDTELTAFTSLDGEDLHA